MHTFVKYLFVAVGFSFPAVLASGADEPIDLGGSHPDRERLVEAILAPASEQPRLIEDLIRLDDPAVAPVLNGFRRGELFYLPGVEEGPESLILVDFGVEVDGKHPVLSVLEGDPVLGEGGGPLFLNPADMRFLRTNSRVRRSINRIVEVASINDVDWSVRRESAERLGASGNRDFLAYLEQRKEIEEDRRVRRALDTGIAMLEFQSSDPEVRVHSLEILASSRSLVAKARLETVIANYDAGAEENGVTDEMAAIAERGIRSIEAHWKRVNLLGDLFRGVSLGSVLLMMAMGLAITFGLMGVINMAHGELMVVGAYATYLVQSVFAGWFGPVGTGFDTYFIVALPAGFLAAALVGLVLERGVIRFLYHRPLESLLATWGVSLVLQQLFRVIFGPSNVQINAPGYLSGNFVVYDVVFAFNRVFVVGFAAFLVLFVWLILARTSLGLNIRAVMQNRSMAACMGVRTRRVNMITFSFGAGLAGLAGACLTQLTNVGPSLGQNHIVDCFMVVVAGGVGNIFGTVFAALGIGATDQLLQPMLGAVMGKITVLFVIILFLQWRPGGLFPARSRTLD